MNTHFPKLSLNGLRAAVLLFATLGASCVGLTADKAWAADSTSNAPDRIERTVENGGVRLTVRLDRDKAAVADPVALEIQIDTPPSVQITVPKLPEAIGELRLRQTANLPNVPVDNARRWTQRYEIESLAPGAVETPAIKISYTTDAGPQQLELPTLPLTIISTLPADADPTKFRDIKGVVEIPTPPAGVPTWVWAIAGAGLLAAAAFWWLRNRARRSLSADQWALAELDRIDVTQLVAAGRVQELYFALTGIVRTYIERRFGIRAPKKTTREFLGAVHDHPVLTIEHQKLLGGFLESADMVKFARLNPDVPQIESTVASARWFVEATAESALESRENSPRSGTDMNQKQRRKFEVTA